MGKIKLLLNVGTCFSATSPFHFTTSLDHKCVWTGHVKEPQYLYSMMMGEKQIREDVGVMCKDAKDKEHLEKMWVEISQFGQKPPSLDVHSEYIEGKWSSDQVNEFFRSPLSIEKYIRYFTRHWENVKGTFEWVGDFSNQNAVLSTPFMLSIRDELLEHFDIKVTMQFRDPIRRLFSSCNKNVKLGYEGEKSPIEVMTEWVSRKGAGGRFVFEDNAYYSQIYERHVEMWGKDNVKAFVMEEFWNPDREKEQLEILSDFLNYKFTKIHENCYYPDMGANAPRYKYLGDQFSSDMVDMTDELYKLCFSHMSEIYSDFIKTFGYMPDEWGK